MARPRGHRLNPDSFEFALAQSGITLTEAADRADQARSSVSGMLGGHHRTSVKNAHKLAAVFGCKPSVLFPTLNANFVEASEEAVA